MSRPSDCTEARLAASATSERRFMSVLATAASEQLESVKIEHWRKVSLAHVGVVVNFVPFPLSSRRARGCAAPSYAANSKHVSPNDPKRAVGAAEGSHELSGASRPGASRPKARWARRTCRRTSRRGTGSPAAGGLRARAAALIGGGRHSGMVPARRRRRSKSIEVAGSPPPGRRRGRRRSGGGRSRTAASTAGSSDTTSGAARSWSSLPKPA